MVNFFNIIHDKRRHFIWQDAVAIEVSLGLTWSLLQRLQKVFYRRRTSIKRSRRAAQSKMNRSSGTGSVNLLPAALWSPMGERAFFLAALSAWFWLPTTVPAWLCQRAKSLPNQGKPICWFHRHQVMQAKILQFTAIKMSCAFHTDLLIGLPSCLCKCTCIEMHSFRHCFGESCWKLHLLTLPVLHSGFSKWWFGSTRICNFPQSRPSPETIGECSSQTTSKHKAHVQTLLTSVSVSPSFFLHPNTWQMILVRGFPQAPV